MLCHRKVSQAPRLLDVTAFTIDTASPSCQLPSLACRAGICHYHCRTYRSGPAPHTTRCNRQATNERCAPCPLTGLLEATAPHSLILICVVNAALLLLYKLPA